MNLFARVVARTERWIESIDRERDSLARSLEVVVSEQERGGIRGRLEYLQRERDEVVKLLARLQAEQYQPPLMFSERPKMVKAGLVRVRKRA